MPTGYTADVQDGKVTEFPEFAMQCARAFGALVMMRDDPMDAPIVPEEPSSYQRDALAKADNELARLRSMTHEEIVAAYRTAVDEAVAYRDEYEQRKDTERRRYEAMLEKARAWTPPTVDHRGLKDFMVKQLAESIEWDCGGSYSPAVPHEGADAWYAGQVREAKRMVEYHRDEQRKDAERVAGRNLWVRQLRDSLTTTGGPSHG